MDITVGPRVIVTQPKPTTTSVPRKSPTQPPKATSTVSSVRSGVHVCKAIKQKGVFLNAWKNLPSSVFSIEFGIQPPLTGDPNNRNTTPTAYGRTWQTVQFRQSEQPTQSAMGAHVVCKTLNYTQQIAKGERVHITYKPESITSSASWKTFRCVDVGESTQINVNNTTFYSALLFDGNPKNNQSRDQRCDGHISITTDQPLRTILFVNEL